VKTVNDWLDARYEEMATFPGFSNKSVDFEQQADILRRRAHKDGYSAKDLAEHCGGNVAAYLMNRVNTINRGEIRSAVQSAQSVD
jgi:hypothetical protein